MTARKTSGTVSRLEVKQAVDDVYAAVDRSTKELTETLSVRFQSAERLSVEQFGRINDRLNSIEELHSERQNTVNRRLDSLEEDAKKQRWWTAIAGAIGGLLGFGGGKVT